MRTLNTPEKQFCVRQLRGDLTLSEETIVKEHQWGPSSVKLVKVNIWPLTNVWHNREETVSIQKKTKNKTKAKPFGWPSVMIKNVETQRFMKSASGVSFMWSDESGLMWECVASRAHGCEVHLKGARGWYIQTPWRCCWRRSLESWCSSRVWVWGFRRRVKACKSSSSKDRHLWACQKSRGRPGCPDSPCRNICRARKTKQTTNEKKPEMEYGVLTCHKGNRLFSETQKKTKQVYEVL